MMSWLVVARVCDTAPVDLVLLRAPCPGRPRGGNWRRTPSRGSNLTETGCRQSHLECRRRNTARDRPAACSHRRTGYGADACPDAGTSRRGSSRSAPPGTAVSVLGRRVQAFRWADVVSVHSPTLPCPELVSRQGMSVCIGAKPTPPLARGLWGSAGLHGAGQCFSHGDACCTQICSVPSSGAQSRLSPDILHGCIFRGSGSSFTATGQIVVSVVLLSSFRYWLVSAYRSCPGGGVQ